MNEVGRENSWRSVTNMCGLMIILKWP